MVGAGCRCPWTGSDPLYISYHDREWGRPIHDDQKLYEMLLLELMQAGLSWITILRKREAFRTAFDDFAIHKIANYTRDDVERLMKTPGIIHNRLKIGATINNAKCFLGVAQTCGSFDKMLWKYVDGKPIIGNWIRWEEVPASTPLSKQISTDLKKLGFTFVGPTIIYSFMQAVGLVNDHIIGCPFHPNSTQKVP